MAVLTQFQIDAFSQTVFKGNPAAVLIVGDGLSPSLMQSIAMENNLSETAFLTQSAAQQTGHYDLRWFTPCAEIDFCGHATLASAHALFHETKAARAQDDAYHFKTRIGLLKVEIDTSHGSAPLYSLVAPIFTAAEFPLTAQIQDAFPIELISAFTAGPYLYVVAKSAEQITNLSPNIAFIKALPFEGVGLTAAGGASGADCTSRFFVPDIGIDEDPVTGSAHAAIGPYWAKQLGRTSLRAYQASTRGGWIDIKVQTDTLTLSGHAVTFSKSELYIA